MPRFAYVARDRGGQLRQGTISAPTADQAGQMIRSQGLTLVSIKEKAFKIPLLTGVSGKELVIFTRTFVTMLQSGLPIVQSLNILAQQQKNKFFKKAILGRKCRTGLYLIGCNAKLPRCL